MLKRLGAWLGRRGPSGRGEASWPAPAVAEAPTVLERLLAHFGDPRVDEILVTGAHGMAVIGEGLAPDREGTRLAPSPFADREEFFDWLIDFAQGQQVRLDPVIGSAGGSFAGGQWRWHAVLPPLAPDGPVLSLRRHRFGALGLGSFRAQENLKTALMRAVGSCRLVVIAGPTGSGKTSLLNTIVREALGAERLVIIESLAELPLPNAAAVRLLERPPGLEGQAGVGMDRLLREALRLRPDRIVVGEVRGPEAATLLEAAATGHSGVLTTLHATDPAGALSRLSRLAGTAAPFAGPDGGGIAIVMMARGSPPAILSVGCPG